VGLTSPQDGWVYYNLYDNKTYIYRGSTWEVMAYYDQNAVIWLGVFAGTGMPTAPGTFGQPYTQWQKNMAFYHDAEQVTYINTGGTTPIWTPIANYNPAAIIWKGSFAIHDAYLAAPHADPSEANRNDLANPKTGWAYYNTLNSKTYVFYSGTWGVMAATAADPNAIIWLGTSAAALNGSPPAPYTQWQKNMAYYNSADHVTYINTAATGTGPTWLAIANNFSPAFVWKGSQPSAAALGYPHQAGWAYYNNTDGKTYFCTAGGSPGTWEVIATDADPNAIIWKGSVSASNPQAPGLGTAQDNWAYYNTVNFTTYVYKSGSWVAVANYNPGALIWKGSVSAPDPQNPAGLTSPQEGWVYYNTYNYKTYVYKGATNQWQVLAETDPNAIIWKGTVSGQTAVPPSAGTTGWPTAYSASTPAKKNWAYYNMADNTTYLCTADGTSGPDSWKGTWQAIAVSNALVWKGSYNESNPTSPGSLSSPLEGWVYYNLYDNKTYVYHSGSWVLMSWGIKIWTVTFDTAPGSAISEQAVVAGAKAARPADPFRSGYVFAGWKKGAAAWSFNTPIDADTTLTAQWTAAASPYDREDFGAGTPVYAAPAGVYNAETWAAAVAAVNQADGNYVIDITGSFTLPAVEDALNPSFVAANTVVSVRGRNGAVVSLDNTVTNSLLKLQSNTSTVLRDITLMGKSASNTPLVEMKAYSKLTLKDGAVVSGFNSANEYGISLTGTQAALVMEGNSAVRNMDYGVILSANYTEMTMNGSARVYGNNDYGVFIAFLEHVKFSMGGNAQIYGNGVNGLHIRQSSNGTFTMSDSARIYNNSNTGVSASGHVSTSKFFMSGNAQIYGNGGGGSGGGVSIATYTHFFMSGNAQIYGNTATKGGGVYLDQGGGETKLFMDGNAQIYGNKAWYDGGGVYMQGGSLFMAGGVIYGSNAQVGVINTASYGAALCITGGTALMGSYDSAGDFTQSGAALSTSEDTIRGAP
jgi:hypothetical protein